MAIKLEDVKENSIEEIICKPMAALKQYPMDDSTTELFIRLTAVKDVDAFGLVQKLKKETHFIMLMERRIMLLLDIEIENRVKVALLYIGASPSIIYMWLYCLQFRGKKSGNFKWTFERLCMEVIPFGLPSDEDIDKIWCAQKVLAVGLNDNLIDMVIAARSIMTDLKSSD